MCWNWRDKNWDLRNRACKFHWNPELGSGDVFWMQGFDQEESRCRALTNALVTWQSFSSPRELSYLGHHLCWTHPGHSYQQPCSEKSHVETGDVSKAVGTRNSFSISQVALVFWIHFNYLHPKFPIEIMFSKGLHFHATVKYTSGFQGSR